MGLIDLFRAPPKAELVRSDSVVSFDDWAGFLASFQFSGVNYTLPGSSQEDIGSSFTGMARGGMKGNGVVFACMVNRMLLFAEARFMFRNLRRGRAGDLFDYQGSDLGLLRAPWEGGTTGDLLSQMLQHVDIAGNSYVARRAGRLTPLRPDWTTIIGGVPGEADASVWHPDARVLGYSYREGGPALDKEPVFFLADEVAHFAPIPDPEARFRGMSWLTPIVREVMADKAMNDHKISFLENGATPNLVVKLAVDDLAKFRDFVSEFKKGHEGVGNAYKTMFLAGGADATVVGADLQQMDFKTVQGAGETRIAAAAGVPPVIVGLSEGLAAATYANYASAKRRFADNTMRPLWRNAAGSLAQIIRVPTDAELWYDDRDISALQEDQKDAAAIMQVDAASVQTLVNSGFEPESVKKAVSARDVTLLVHTGLMSVQLQPPGTTDPATPPDTPAAADTPDVPAPAANGRSDYPLELLERLVRDDRASQPINVHFQPPDVNVDVHTPAVTVEPTRFEEGAISVNVEAAPAPEVTVNVESPTVTVERGGKRRVDFGDGRSATVTEGDVKTIEYDDGRVATVTEVDE
jgi:phage portal protein BeeE